MRRLTMICMAAGSLVPQPVMAMDVPRLSKPSDYTLPVYPQPVNQTFRRNSEADARKRDILRTVRLVILGGVACAGLIVLLRLAASNREPAVRSESGRILPRRRSGRVLQLESPDRHAPETRR